ncbi:hypothetical protein AX15_001663 [Amanita polypyramis BW_CC]|nr:hypothetical protein AX15_001663 [Amanita polypyramis BW_CC]
MLKPALYDLVRTRGFHQISSPDSDCDEETDFILDKHDYSLLLRARENLIALWVQKAVPPPHASYCSSQSGHCAVSFGEVQTLYGRLVHDSKLFEKYQYDPLSGLIALLGAPWEDGQEWETGSPITDFALCSVYWKSVWREERKNLWIPGSSWTVKRNRDRMMGRNKDRKNSK